MLDSVGFGEAELVYSCSNCMGECYDLRFCTNTHKSKYMEYCAYCYGCEHCFGCFGLVGKEYHIFNKPYSPEDFNRKRSEIEHAMKREGSWGAFFPPSFAPNPYEESIASVFFPLSPEEQRARGFRISAPLEAKSLEIAERNALPSRLEDLESKSFPIVFWDPDAQRRVQITERDYRFSKEHGAPLPYNFYASRLKAHCALMPFGGEMRELIDSSGRTFLTALPLILDGRTVSEGEYEDRIVE